MAQKGEGSLLEARIDDLLRRAEQRFEVAMSDFLTPGEAASVRVQLSSRHCDCLPVFYGGYAGCERTRLVVLPSFMETEAISEGGALASVYPDIASEAVAAVSIKGSGYRALSHRDYMGSVLAMGLERHVIGDIVTDGDFRATVFCTPGIASYLCAELHKIANDTVKVAAVEIGADFRVERQFAPIRDTVASARLDCIVAALAGLSRERAQNAIRADEVEVDYLPENRVDRPIAAGSTVTVRRVGKFVVRSVEEQTKKGRYRLVADKYI